MKDGLIIALEIIIVAVLIAALIVFPLWVMS